MISSIVICIPIIRTQNKSKTFLSKVLLNIEKKRGTFFNLFAEKMTIELYDIGQVALKILTKSISIFKIEILFVVF